MSVAGSQRPAPGLAAADTIAPADYRFLAELLYRETGLALGDDKAYLLRARLGPLAATWGRGTVAGVAAALRAEQHGPRAGGKPATRAVCDAMTTNETLFFRDTHPFDALRDVILPSAVVRQGAATPSGPPRPLRIWCAAASTGQEPYSVAMCAAVAAPRLRGTPVEILGTDYSPAAIQRARAGTYSDFEGRRGLPPTMAAQFFTPCPGGGLQATDALRRAVRFDERNLLAPFAGLGTFDVIFCRNVLLYFDAATKRDVLDRMADLLAPGGVLFLGATETPLGLTPRLTRATRLPTPAYERSATAR